MHTTSLLAPTETLERTVRHLERRLVQGVARRDEIEAYVRLQLELADRAALGGTEPQSR